MHGEAIIDCRRPVSLNQDQRLVREWLGLARSTEPPPILWAGLEFDRGPDVPALERALNAVVRRHEILRTEFISPGPPPRSRADAKRTMGELAIGTSVFGYRVHDAAPVTLAHGALDRPHRDPATATLAHDGLGRDLERCVHYDAPPHLRATLYRCAGDRHLLSLVVPHLVGDGASMRVLLAELAASYHAACAGGCPRLPALPAQYGDFAAWQRQQLTDDEATHLYWRQRLTEFLPAMVALNQLPYSRPAPAAASAASATAVLVVAPELAAQVRAYCASRRFTMYMAWLAAVAATLHLYTGRDRVGVISYLANRALPCWHPVVGWFSNSYVCGLGVGGRTGRDLFVEARRTALDAIQHQAMPTGFVWRSLVRDGAVPADLSLPTWVTFDYYPAAATGSSPWLSPIWWQVAGVRREPALAIVVGETAETLTLGCSYPTGVFDRPGAHQILADVAGVMRALVTAPEAPVATLRHAVRMPL